MRDQQGKMSDERDRMRHRSQGRPLRQAQGRLFEAITQRGGHGRAARIVVSLCHGTTIARVFVAIKFSLCVKDGSVHYRSSGGPGRRSGLADLPGPELPHLVAGLHQRVQGPRRLHSPVLEDDDLVGAAQGRVPRYDQRRHVPHLTEPLPEQPFRQLSAVPHGGRPL